MKKNQDITFVISDLWSKKIIFICFHVPHFRHRYSVIDVLRGHQSPARKNGPLVSDKTSFFADFAELTSNSDGNWHTERKAASSRPRRGERADEKWYFTEISSWFLIAAAAPRPQPAGSSYSFSYHQPPLNIFYSNSKIIWFQFSFSSRVQHSLYSFVSISFAFLNSVDWKPQKCHVKECKSQSIE